MTLRSLAPAALFCALSTLALAASTDPIVGNHTARADLVRKEFKNGEQVSREETQINVSLDFFDDFTIRSADNNGLWKKSNGRYSADLSESATQNARMNTGDPNATAKMRFFKMRLDAQNEIHGRVRASQKSVEDGVKMKRTVKGKFVTYQPGP